MKQPLFFILFISLFVTTELTAQKLSAPQQQKVNALFKSSKVVYFKFQVSSAQEVAPVSKIISIDSAKGTTVFAHATKEQFSKFIVMNYPYEAIKKAAPKKPVKKSVKKK